MARGGIELLRDGDRESANNLFEQLGRYGLFVVPYGTVESWLSDLGVRKRKTEWLITMFDRMGDDPSAPDYVEPGPDDVWAFLDNIKTWFNNPRRQGIPV